MIELRIGNNFSQVILKGDLFRELSQVLSYKLEGSEFSPKFKSGVWDGRIKLLQRDGRFPSGLLQVAKQFLVEKGVEHELVDYRGEPPGPSHTKDAKFDLVPRYYQNDALNVAKRREKGVFVVGVGGGKSLLSAMIVNDKKVETLVVVPNLDLKSQFFTDYFRWFGKIVSEDLSRGSIVVANYQSLAKLPAKVFARFEMLIFDEFHHCSATSLKTINEHCVNAYYKYGFSATFLRTDGTDMEMFGVLSNVLYSKTAYDLIQEGFLVPPKIFVINHEAKFYPFGYAQAYAHLIQDEEFNKKICHIAKKLSLTKQCLILVKRIEHGKLLASMLNCVFLNGEVDTEYRNTTKAKFINKEIKLLVATNIFGEGVNIPSVDCLINARAEKSEIMTRQGIGRALRLSPGKTEALIFDFMITGQKHLNEHSKERVRSYREEKFNLTIV